MVFHCFLKVSTKLISDLLPNCLLVKSGSLVAESKQKLSLSHTSVVTLAFQGKMCCLWFADTSILRFPFTGQIPLMRSYFYTQNCLPRPDVLPLWRSIRLEQNWRLSTHRFIGLPLAYDYIKTYFRQVSIPLHTQTPWFVDSAHDTAPILFLSSLFRTLSLVETPAAFPRQFSPHVSKFPRKYNTLW